MNESYTQMPEGTETGMAVVGINFEADNVTIEPGVQRIGERLLEGVLPMTLEQMLDLQGLVLPAKESSPEVLYTEHKDRGVDKKRENPVWNQKPKRKGDRESGNRYGKDKTRRKDNHHEGRKGVGGNGPKPH